MGKCLCEGFLEWFADSDFVGRSARRRGIVLRHPAGDARRGTGAVTEQGWKQNRTVIMRTVRSRSFMIFLGSCA